MFGWGKHVPHAGYPSIVLPSTIRFNADSHVLDDAQDAHQQVYDQGGGYDNPDNQAKFSHEVVAGAASFGAMKLFEDHQRKEGKTYISLSIPLRTM